MSDAPPAQRDPSSSGGPAPVPPVPAPAASSGDRFRPLSRSALYDLAEQETLDAPAFEGALRLLGVRPGAKEWGVYWFHLLTLCGALLLASGIIFFIAWNWKGLHHFAKFGLLEAVIAAGALIAIWRGVRSVAGSAALLAAGLCMGPLLAVFGQTYMSGAHFWELFRAWTLMLLPFALFGRQAGLWLMVWLTAGVWGFGYMQHMTQSASIFYGLPEFILLQMAAVAVWEFAMRHTDDTPGREWLHAVWLPRLMLFIIWTALTALVISLIFSWREGWDGTVNEVLFLPFRPSILAAYAVGQILLYLWYRRGRHDLFMLGCGVFSACAVLVAAMVKAELFLEPSPGSLLVWGLIIAGLTALCGKLLLYWQRAMEEEESERHMAFLTMDADKLLSRWQRRMTAREAGEKAENNATRDFFGTLPGGPGRLTRSDWPRLWNILTKHGLWPDGRQYPLPPPSAAPWYINTMLSVGGWISAVLLICFLGFLLSMTFNVGRDFEVPLMVCGVIFLGIGAACSRVPGLFARQFGLAGALAGAIAVCVALVSLGKSEQYWSLPCLVVALLTFPLIQNRAYRYIAAVCGAFFLYALFDALVVGTQLRLSHYAYSYYEAPDAAPVNWWTMTLGVSAFWGVLCALIAWGWHTESRWMTRRRLALALPPLLHGALTAMLLLLVASLAAQNNYDFRSVYHLLPSRACFGLGAAAGFVLLVFLLGRGRFRDREQDSGARTATALPWLCLACSLPVLPLGWFLPGAALALFGFLISRHTGNRVLLGASSLFLAAYIFYYYYNLEATLLYKSLNLTVCGLGLLIVAVIARHFFIPAEDGPVVLPCPALPAACPPASVPEAAPTDEAAPTGEVAPTGEAAPTDKGDDMHAGNAKAPGAEDGPEPGPETAPLSGKNEGEDDSDA